MKSYPTVNWWRGNLRMYESRLSFASRFARLNRISVSQCESYFGGMLAEQQVPALNQLEEMADLLDEDVATLRETFVPSVDLPRGSEAPIKKGKTGTTVRYCEECAALGYHSYLHEYTWLARCPFHAVQLRYAYGRSQTGSTYVRRCHALTQVMVDACPGWPCTGEQAFDPDKYESFVWLSNWLTRVSRASSLFLKKRVWSCVEQPFREMELDNHIVGRLHALEPIPLTMKVLFEEVQDGWGAVIQRFPIQAKRELSKLRDLGLDSLFSLYKRIAPYAVSPPGFARETDSCVQDLQSRHPICRCEWGRQKAGSFYHWVRVHPNDWPQWNLVCPFDVAKEQLELATGRRLEAMTRRQRDKEEMDLIVQSHVFLERGLVGITPGANVSPEGRLYCVPQIWPPMEWIGNSWLNAVLDATIQSEVDVLHNTLGDWLDEIADGNTPAQFIAPPPLIWLSETEDGLVLISWSRKRTRT